LATYKGAPNYSVSINGKNVRFDWLGEYTTDDASEVKVLDGLAPRWIKRVDRKTEEAPEELRVAETPEKVEKGPDRSERPQPRRKPSAK